MSALLRPSGLGLARIDLPSGVGRSGSPVRKNLAVAAPVSIRLSSGFEVITLLNLGFRFSRLDLGLLLHVLVYSCYSSRICADWNTKPQFGGVVIIQYYMYAGSGGSSISKMAVIFHRKVRFTIAKVQERA